jgi:hypothetical protein
MRKKLTGNVCRNYHSNGGVSSFRTDVSSVPLIHPDHTEAARDFLSVAA